MHSSLTLSGVLAIALSSTALATDIVTTTRTSTTFVTKVTSVFPSGFPHGTGTGPSGTGHTKPTGTGPIGTGTGGTPPTTTTKPTWSNAPPPPQTCKPTSVITIYDIYSLSIGVTPVVSIISANPTETCIEVACPTDVLRTNPKACGALTAPVTITEGVTIIEYATSTITYGCGGGNSHPTGTGHGTGHSMPTVTGTSPHHHPGGTGVSVSGKPTGTCTAVETDTYTVSCEIDVIGAYGNRAATCTTQASWGPGHWQSTSTITGTHVWRECIATVTAGLDNLSCSSSSSSRGRIPPKPTTTHTLSSTDRAPTSSTFGGLAAAGMATPAMGSLAGLLLGLAALM